jgi:hypothetical protein
MHSRRHLQQRAPRTLGALLTVTPCRKVYIGGWLRIHHGLVGEAAIAAAALPFGLAVRAALIVLGAGIVWDDRHDWPFPVRDRDHMPPHKLAASRSVPPYAQIK